MKKITFIFTMLVTILVILGGCSNNSEKTVFIGESDNWNAELVEYTKENTGEFFITSNKSEGVSDNLEISIIGERLNISLNQEENKNGETIHFPVPEKDLTQFKKQEEIKVEIKWDKNMEKVIMEKIEK